MTLMLKLLFGQVRCHPARFLLTTLAIVAAAGVVIWVVSGYDALVAQFDDFADEYLGRYQLVVAPAELSKNPFAAPPGLSSNMIRELGQDPAVKLLDAESHLKATVTKVEPPGNAEVAGPGPATNSREGRTRSEGTASRSGPGGPGGGPRGNAPRGFDPRRPGAFPPPSPTVVATAAAEPPYPLSEGHWISGETASNQAAISSRTAEMMRVQVGDHVTVEVNKRKTNFEIVCIVEQVRTLGSGRGGPAPSRGPATSALYISIPAAEQILQAAPEVTIAQLVLNDGEDAERFRAKWSERLSASSPPLILMSAHEVEDDLDSSRAASGARNQAYSATGIALLASLFIIFTALSMGVHERSRQFAVLRAVALTPRQIGLLILFESLLLGAIGWIGGLVAGMGLLTVMSLARPTMFTSGPALGSWCLILSGCCAFGGALAAAILPAWRAMHISPLDAMTTQVVPLSQRVSRSLTFIGLGLIAVNPLLVFAFPMKDDARYPVYVAVGCSSMALGFILLAPWVIQSLERWLGPVIARLLRLDPRLLAAELSSNLWRTVGTCIALTLGLGLYVSTQIWGYSMLQPFVPGAWVPDLMVNFTTGGLPASEFAAVADVVGIRTETCLPLAVEQPKLARDLTHSAERVSVSRQDSVIMIGLDPDQGIGNSDALLTLRFVEGDRTSAAQLMKESRGCVVPDHFAREAGLKLGDRFEVLPPETPQSPLEYTIAGIVELPGWHWMTKFSGVRRRDPRAAAMVFASYDTVMSDYALPSTNFFWTQLESGASLDKIGTSLQAIADRNPGDKQPVNFQGTWSFGAMDFGTNVRLSTPGEVQERIAVRASDMIWGMSQLPLVTLAIAGLGVLNTIMASIRARLWSIGVMRAVGLTRSGLARLILAESLMIGLVACGLSLAFGAMAGWCGAGISQYVSFFGGLNPSLVIPWQPLSWGFGLTLLLCLLAALFPAIRISRSELLPLLQSGRASM
ncbi:FtsX-like permease family protein [bacterium]|nr:FtsX-like permease family protein [bacterium]